MWPGVIGCFGSFSIRQPSQGNPVEVEKSPARVPAAFVHESALLIQSQLVAFFAASVAGLMAFLSASPVMPSSVKVLQSEHPANPRQPTSTASQQVCRGVIWAGILSCLLRFNCSCQSVALARRPEIVQGCWWGFSLALRNVMVFGWWWPLMVLMAMATLSVTAEVPGHSASNSPCLQGSLASC